jgi:hypothetical protein
MTDGSGGGVGRWGWGGARGGGCRVATGSAGGGRPAQSFNIVGLRMNKVTLYRECAMDKGVSISREDVEKRNRGGPLPTQDVRLLLGEDGRGRLLREGVRGGDGTGGTGGQGQECRTRVAGRPPKTGAVRGVGEKLQLSPRRGRLGWALAGLLVAGCAGGAGGDGAKPASWSPSWLPGKGSSAPVLTRLKPGPHEASSLAVGEEEGPRAAPWRRARLRALRPLEQYLNESGAVWWRPRAAPACRGGW